MLRANASEIGVNADLKAVPAAFLIHCYSQGVSPTVSALEAYTRESPEGFLDAPVRLIRGVTNRTSQ
jgi:hypothetical protein